MLSKMQRLLESCQSHATQRLSQKGTREDGTKGIREHSPTFLSLDRSGNWDIEQVSESSQSFLFNFHPISHHGWDVCTLTCYMLWGAFLSLILCDNPTLSDVKWWPFCSIHRWCRSRIQTESKRAGFCLFCNVWGFTWGNKWLVATRTPGSRGHPEVSPGAGAGMTHSEHLHVASPCGMVTDVTEGVCPQWALRESQVGAGWADLVLQVTKSFLLHSTGYKQVMRSAQISRKGQSDPTSWGGGQGHIVESVWDGKECYHCLWKLDSTLGRKQ